MKSNKQEWKTWQVTKASAFSGIKGILFTNFKTKHKKIEIFLNYF